MPTGPKVIGGTAPVLPVTELRRKRLGEAIAKAGIDQSELARRVGCTPGAVNQILSGRTRRSRYLMEMALALDVSMRWLLGETDDPDDGLPPMPPRLTSEEERLLEIYRELPKKERDALKLLMKRMITDEETGS